jgi:hypothetical protein
MAYALMAAVVITVLASKKPSGMCMKFTLSFFFKTKGHESMGAFAPDLHGRLKVSS